MDIRMRRLQPFILALFLVLAGCSSHVQHLPKIEPDANIFPPLEERSSLLIGIALSGGGSRAAYFGATGIEALTQLRTGPGTHSILEQVSYISSVSGGSVASSYFVTHKPDAEVHALSADGSLTPQYRDFFDKYLTAMSANYQRSLELRQFFNIRWFNSNQRATSLAETLSSAFLGERTFEDLYEREKKRNSPRLILNATLYNNGRRVVMTTVPSEDFKYDFIPRLQQELKTNRPLPESLERAKVALLPVTLKDEEADPRQIPLAYAVTASASFPFFIGPITVQVAGKESYLHVGDGGLFDNQGTESLVELFLKKLADKKAKRALVIAFDSSFPFWVKNDALDRMKNGFDIFVKDSGRIIGIMEQRANAYQAMVWHILQSERKVLPDDTIIKVLVLRHTDDAWLPQQAWQSAIPDSCDKSEFKERDSVRQHMALIPTLFKIESECDRALLRAAAQGLVQNKRKEITDFLEKPSDM